MGRGREDSPRDERPEGVDSPEPPDPRRRRRRSATSAPTPVTAATVMADSQSASPVPAPPPARRARTGRPRPRRRRGARTLRRLLRGPRLGVPTDLADERGGRRLSGLGRQLDDLSREELEYLHAALDARRGAAPGWPAPPPPPPPPPPAHGPAATPWHAAAPYWPSSGYAAETPAASYAGWPPPPPPTQPPPPPSQTTPLTAGWRGFDWGGDAPVDGASHQGPRSLSPPGSGSSLPSLSPTSILPPYSVRNFTADALGLYRHDARSRDCTESASLDPRRQIENRFAAAGDRLAVDHEHLMRSDYLFYLRRHLDAVSPDDLRTLVQDRVFSLRNAPSLELALALADETLCYLQFHRLHRLPVNPGDPFLATCHLLPGVLLDRLELADLSCVLGPEEARRVRRLALDPEAAALDGTAEETLEAPAAPPAGRAFAVLAAWVGAAAAVRRQYAARPGGWTLRGQVHPPRAAELYRGGLLSDLLWRALRSHHCGDPACRLRLRKVQQAYRLSLFFCAHDEGDEDRRRRRLGRRGRPTSPELQAPIPALRRRDRHAERDPPDAPRSPRPGTTERRRSRDTDRSSRRRGRRSPRSPSIRREHRGRRRHRSPRGSRSGSARPPRKATPPPPPPPTADPEVHRAPTVCESPRSPIVEMIVTEPESEPEPEPRPKDNSTLARLPAGPDRPSSPPLDADHTPGAEAESNGGRAGRPPEGTFFATATATVAGTRATVSDADPERTRRRGTRTVVTSTTVVGVLTTVQKTVVGMTDEDDGDGEEDGDGEDDGAEDGDAEPQAADPAARTADSSDSSDSTSSSSESSSDSEDSDSGSDSNSSSDSDDDRRSAENIATAPIVPLNGSDGPPLRLRRDEDEDEEEDDDDDDEAVMDCDLSYSEMDSE